MKTKLFYFHFLADFLLQLLFNINICELLTLNIYVYVIWSQLLLRTVQINQADFALYNNCVGYLRKFFSIFPLSFFNLN